MGKEKQCECCHEWWYDSNVKENLCPNCYDYFKQLKRQIAETEQEFLVFQEDSIRNEQIYIRELAEKDKEIERLKERLSVFDNFKDNYGYTNYDDSEILEDLQSRAFQREDDTAVIESLLDFFDIYDENKILPKVEEMNEKLKCAIVPKFKIGQEVYKVYTKDQRFPFKVKIIGFKITQTEEKNSVLYDTAEDGFDMDWCPEKILFETLEEAEKKLQELRGGK